MAGDRMKRWRCGLATYGHERRKLPPNSVLLTNCAIRRAFANDPDFELRDYSPPLINDQDVDMAAAGRMHEKVEADLDVIVAQAALGLESFQRAQEVCPEAVRVLHRDSTHCRTHLRLLKAQQVRYGIEYTLHYEADGGALLKRELAEYDLADLVTTNSRWVEGTFREQGFERIKNIGPQVIDLKRWRCPPRRWKGSPLVFLYVGSLGLRKGILDTLEAWRMADAPGTLVIAGVSDHPASWPMISSAIEESPRTEYISYIPFSQLPAHYRRGAVLIMPTHEEGATMVCHEAMAAGLAVIATPNAGCDLLDDGISGCEVPAGTPDLLALRIREYAANDAERYAHAVEGSQRVGACDLPAYGRRYAAAVKDLLR